MFGPSKDEIWRQLSGQLGGHFVEGGIFKGSVVRARYKQWTITLDSFSRSTGRLARSKGKTRTRYTRMRAPYLNNDGFRFTIYRKSIFSGLGKLLGMQDVEIGDPAFDNAFVIQGNDEQKLRELFANDHLRQLIFMQPTIHLTVQDDDGYFTTRFPEGVDELHFRVRGVITDLYRLTMLYNLFAVILDQLCKIGSAYEDDPKVTL